MKKISIKNKLKKQQIKVLEISQVIFKISEKSCRKNKKKLLEDDIVKKI